MPCPRTVISLLVLTALLRLPAVAAADPVPPADVLAALIRQNDTQVSVWLDGLPPRAASPREASRLTKLVAAAHAQTASRHYRDSGVRALLDRLVATLATRQNADGSFDAEVAAGNPQSPPDSGFALRHLALALALLRADADPAAAPARAGLERLLDRGAFILRTGGVHTPNHRWVICGALAQIEALAPAPANVARIDDWLGEGIDQDRDGQFSERSTIYSSVTDEALLDLAVALRRPALLEPLRRNLEFTLLNADPDGELEHVSSRRQDQLGREPRRLTAYYVPLRYLALLDRNPRFAAAVARLERADLERLTDHVAEWMLWPELRRPLPAPAALPDDFVRHFPDSGLVRVRRGAVSATIFGGGDYAAHRDFSSGLSTNPTFFRFRKGGAVLDSVRIAPSFFNLGYFRSERLDVSPDGHAWLLAQTQRAAYYQPLPAEARRPGGDYPLTDDGRFYSKMDFPRRPRDEKSLTTRVAVRERPGAPGEFELEISSDGTAGIGIVVELCFRSGGSLTGAAPRAGEPDTFILSSGIARYAVGGDTIEVGPGVASAGGRIGNLAGEAYSWRGGLLRAEGVRLYLTGVTPFRHVIQVR
ncbi:MAG: hypothetical protein JNL39_14390 [Opitutaceae bacterium]|nr:hypothetical protein [Opitutaceae bacterium]